MYQNCCKKCGSVSLHTEVKGNNTGLYCDDCGAWQCWLNKDEIRAFEHNKNKNMHIGIHVGNLINTTQYYNQYELNLSKINSIEDCKKILKFLCGLVIKTLPLDVEYGGFGEVSEYFDDIRR